MLLGSYYVQNRSYVDYEDLAPSLVAALIATEDARFESHSGIDFISLARVAVRTIALGDRGQGGGSTITQQLAKNLFPRDTVRDRGKIGRTIPILEWFPWYTTMYIHRLRFALLLA